MGNDETMAAAAGGGAGAGAAPALSAEGWMLRAAACELLALGLRYPGVELAQAVASGEWAEATGEIAAALGLALPEGFADGAAGAVDGAGGAADAGCRGGAAAGGPATGAAEGDADAAALLHALRAEATRLFVGAPEPACSPYEGVWRAADDGVEALLFVNPHSMAVERFCRSCGLGRPEGTNEPLDHAATELELLQHLASLAAARAAGGASAADEAAGGAGPADEAAASETCAAGAAAIGALEPDAAPADDGEPPAGGPANAPDAAPSLPDPSVLPGGSPAAAYGLFMRDHALAWMPRFAAAAAERSRHPFYRATAQLLESFLAVEERTCSVC